MRPIHVPPMPIAPTTTDLADWLRQLAMEIEVASHDNDIALLAENYTQTGSLTETRALDVGSPDLTNVVRVLGTLLADMRAGGSTLRTS
jgi:hypothetical protein